MNRIYSLVAVITIATFAQGCEIVFLAIALDAQKSTKQVSAPSPSSVNPSSEKTSSESIENSESMAVDVSGTYRSDIIGSGSWSLGRFPNIEVILKQNKDEISGTFSGTRSGEIEGILNGDTIKFKWFVTAGRTESGRGEWKQPNDGINWNGTWRSSRGSQGNWNLTKIE